MHNAVFLLRIGKLTTVWGGCKRTQTSRRRRGLSEMKGGFFQRGKGVVVSSFRHTLVVRKFSKGGTT
jgi:hypothetical protein